MRLWGRGVSSERSQNHTGPLQLLTGDDQQYGQREAHAIRHDDEGGQRRVAVGEGGTKRGLSEGL